MPLEAERDKEKYLHIYPPQTPSSFPLIPPIGQIQPEAGPLIVQSRARNRSGSKWAQLVWLCLFSYHSYLTILLAYLCQASRSPPCFAFNPQVWGLGIKEKLLSSWWPDVTLSFIPHPLCMSVSRCTDSLVSITKSLPSFLLPSFLPSAHSFDHEWTTLYVSGTALGTGDMLENEKCTLPFRSSQSGDNST